jgi:soluble P-type ATPase
MLRGAAGQRAEKQGCERNNMRPETNDIRMIALDLDGTTLAPGGHLADRTKKALEEALESGIEVVIATGR